ncbi:hypothetical protein [Brevundimonas variabilis]|uniref:Uncharacterized protein n=1 Tax=Brevundimonas variabilis TaxID=74312 RepID=A0A7W9FFJ5_9CAUL|nr:hypothetical protein [Brevundimonas variabilis]MBB5747400.1 hypothetical protein [Brevundimonas variabilis]
MFVPARASGTATATGYNDLYIRDNFSDTGVIPSSGNPCQSPDIIPLQSGSLTWVTANSTYAGPDQGLSIVNGGVNNIYVRARNLNTVAAAGTASLYYADASLFLLPTSWIPVSAAGGSGSVSLVDGAGSASIAAGGVALSSPSFLLTGLPSGPHYCLISVLQTAAHPVQVPASFQTNAAFSVWVQNNPAVGWRNISYQPSGSVQLIRTFSFASINSGPEYFHFRVLGRGFVAGTTVTAQCTDQLCPINQRLTLPAPDVNGNQVTGFDASVPASFSGNLVMTATSPSGAFPPGAVLTMTYYQYPDLNDALEMRAANLFEISRNTEVGPTPVAARLIMIGECTVTVLGG